jgi:hypothetical protein
VRFAEDAPKDLDIPDLDSDDDDDDEGDYSMATSSHIFLSNLMADAKAINRTSASPTAQTPPENRETREPETTDYRICGTGDSDIQITED